jgi:hypothetical protein
VPDESGNYKIRSFYPLSFEFALLECQIPHSPPFLKGDLAGFLYEVKDVVAQFIGQLCLMNQATTKSGHFAP